MKRTRLIAIALVATLPALVAEAATSVRHRTHHAGARARGIDVSEWQGTIDWTAVKNSGVSFGIARVSDGLHHVDPYFHRNWSEMKTHGMVRGVYQFFRPGQSGVQQANLLLAHIGTLHAGDIPPVLDVEVRDGQSNGTIANRIREWTSTVHARTGLAPIVYTSPGFFDALGNTGKLGADLWVAHWGVSSPRLPVHWKSWTFWQYTSSGHVPGISGRVDLDVFYGTVEDLRNYTGL